MDSEKSFSLQRQVYLVAGALIFVSVLLGTPASKWWRPVAVAVSIGLLYAARTCACRLTRVLSGLPFNKPSSGDIS